MTSLAAIRLVAEREIRQRLRSKAFLATSLITVVIVLAIIILPAVFDGSTEEMKIGSVGENNEAIVENAVLIGNAEDEPDAEPSVSMEIVVLADRAAAEESLSDGDVDAVLIDGSELVTERSGGFFGDSGPVSLLQRAAGAIALEELAAENGQAAQEVIEVLTTDALEVTALAQPDTEDEEGRAVVAYFGLLLLYMAIILYGTWILTGVTEEKSNRVVEVLVSTIQPWHLLAGKIAGIGALAISQFGFTIAVAFVALRTTGSVELPEVSTASLVNLVVWFVLGFLLYATLFGSAGSLVSRIEEAQSAAMPLTLFSVGGFFAGFAVLADPEGAVAIVTTLVPFTAPFVVPIRVSLNAIPAWQYGLSLVITVVSIYIAVRVAGRIYSGGLLRFGTARTKLREAWRSAGG